MEKLAKRIIRKIRKEMGQCLEVLTGVSKAVESVKLTNV